MTCPPPAYCRCGAVLEPDGEYVAQQQHVLPEIRIETVEFHRQKVVCTRCTRTHVAPSGTCTWSVRFASVCAVVRCENRALYLESTRDTLMDAVYSQKGHTLLTLVGYDVNDLSVISPLIT